MSTMREEDQAFQTLVGGSAIFKPPSGGLARVVVALPAKNEEARIEACLEAIDNQAGASADLVVVLLNNCTDRTATIVHTLGPRLDCALHVVEVELPAEQASAGYARHLAMDEACRLAGDDGVLLTTDADGSVDQDWVGANLAAIHAGADAVAGWAELDPVDWGAIPVRLHEDDARECAYDAVCDEIHALLDPDPIDPLPRHTQASGASIAVTVKTYRAAGGMPTVPSGEDRAFIASLRRIDARIRHAPECRVLVSGRIEGRATGGMADTIRRRLSRPDLYLDDRLEPAEDCARRASLRWIVRSAYEAGYGFDALGSLLGLETTTVSESMLRPTFGWAWADLEAISPRLRRRRVPTAGLLGQHVQAEEIRARARHNPLSCRKALLGRMTAG